MKITKDIIYIFLIIIFFITGFFIAGYLNKDKFEQGYVAGWGELEKRVKISSCYDGIGQNYIVKSLSGEVKSVEDKKFFLKINPLSLFDDPGLNVREVALNENTVILEYQLRDEAEYQNEINEYYQKAAEDKNFDEQKYYPSKYELVKINFADLETGDVLLVEAEDNIREEKTFNASRITVQAKN